MGGIRMSQQKSFGQEHLTALWTGIALQGRHRSHNDNNTQMVGKLASRPAIETTRHGVRRLQATPTTYKSLGLTLHASQGKQ
jgi:hypothetical protein